MKEEVVEEEFKPVADEEFQPDWDGPLEEPEASRRPLQQRSQSSTKRWLTWCHLTQRWLYQLP